MSLDILPTLTTAYHDKRLRGFRDKGGFVQGQQWLYVAPPYFSSPHLPHLVTISPIPHNYPFFRFVVSVAPYSFAFFRSYSFINSGILSADYPGRNATLPARRSA